jgi:hypothetical protein
MAGNKSAALAATDEIWRDRLKRQLHGGVLLAFVSDGFWAFAVSLRRGPGRVR